MKNALCLFLIALSITPTIASISLAQNLPQGRLANNLKEEIRKARKSRMIRMIVEAKYSPDGTKLAVAGHRGIWLFDILTELKHR